MRMDQPIKSDGIAIPMEIIRAWQDRKAELDGIIADAQRESTEINRKLEAVAVLAPELAPPGFVLTPPPEAHEEATSVTAEIGKVVREHNGLLLPKQIKLLLRNREGVPPFTDNYFYTALKRGLDKKLLRKEGEFYGPY